MDIERAYDEMDKMFQEKFKYYDGYIILDLDEIPKGKYKPFCVIAITDDDGLSCMVEEFFAGAVDDIEKNFIAFFMPQEYGRGYAWEILGTKPKQTNK